jgi:hypothetical protein
MRIFFMLVFFFSIMAFLILSDFKAQPYAAPRGCCKQRATIKHPWRNNGMNFPQCQDLNQRLDNGDNIYIENGIVWWDRAC